ncbi:MAG TPA: transcriptional regulator [Nitrosopumilaceae archaeon]|nr:transcriptional regulator [Nitrosopumilaceae archaeon]
MIGVDTLLVKSLDTVIRANLSEKTLQKIENRLFEKYGMSITQSLGEFQKLDEVLREFFGAGAEGLEKQILENVCKLEKTKDKDHEWLTIEDQALTKVILEAFGDDDKKKILTSSIEDSHIISEILEKCAIPQTSGYRKINSMINDGLLITDGYINTADGKKVNKYISVFRNVKIDIVKNKITIKVQIGKELLNHSQLIPIIQRS